MKTVGTLALILVMGVLIGATLGLILIFKGKLYEVIYGSIIGGLLLLIGIKLELIETYINTVLVILFLLILPTVNAILDLISVVITRYLSEKILNEDRWYIILSHAIIDLTMAFVFLSLLALLLIISIDAFNTFFVDNFKHMILIQDLIRSIEIDPFSGDSLWITLMLLSTLIPTFIHFVIAIYGSLILFGSRKTKKDKMIAILQKENSNIKSVEVTKVANYFATKWLITIIFAFILTFALGVGVYKVWF